MGPDPIYHRRMKITKLETLRLEECPNLLWLRVHSDEGIIGLGETHRAAPAVEEYVHEYIAPRVLGQDPLEVERLSRSLVGYLGFRGSGVETRAISAFDIALWDHYARVVNQPLYQVLGGASRAAIRTYNTCAGSGYLRHTRAQTPATCRPRSALRRRSPSSTLTGTRIRSAWTASLSSKLTRPARRRRSAARKFSPAAGASRISSRPASRASSCSTSPGAAASARRGASRRSPTPGSCR